MRSTRDFAGLSSLVLVDFCSKWTGGFGVIVRVLVEAVEVEVVAFDGVH